MVKADFTAWSLYTGPSQCKNLFDDGSSPWVVGQWDGINAVTVKEEVRKDIELRIAVIINAFKNALPQFKTRDRHFVIPEFFFHSKQGPYPYVKIKVDDKIKVDKDGIYPFEYIVFVLKEELKKCIPDDDNSYTILMGTALTSNKEDYSEFLGSPEVLARLDALNEIIIRHDIYNTFMNHDFMFWPRGLINKVVENDPLNELNEFMVKARSNPLCTVRNRGAYFHFNEERENGVEVFIYEKQDESNVDLTMGVFKTIEVKKKEIKIIDANGMITEWLANYPSISIIRGDKQTTPNSTNARFSPSGYNERDIGVEICLDHLFQRLRRTVDMSNRYGADADNFPLAKQFIVSGGMQIHDHAVAVRPNSVIFNSDGTDPATVLEGNKGITSGGVYTHSISSKWKGRDSNDYNSHSQLAFTTNDSIIKGFNNAKGSRNIKALTYHDSGEGPYNNITDSYNSKIIHNVHPVSKNWDKDLGNLFATNEGELHHYTPK